MNDAHGDDDLVNIITRAIMNAGFRNLLFNDYKTAIKGYKLSVDEVEFIKSLR